MLNKVPFSQIDGYWTNQKTGLWKKQRIEEKKNSQKRGVSVYGLSNIEPISSD
jgi:hypothetical protein